MNIVYKNILTILIFAVMFFSTGSADEIKKIVPQDKANSAKQVIMNFAPADPVTYTRFENSADNKTIQHWAKNRGLDLVHDLDPLVDNRAFFVSPYGSLVKINGIMPSKPYFLYVDFVRYKGGNGGLSSRLVVKADGEKVYECVFGDVKELSYVAIEIPRNLVYDGEVTIEFQEYAATPGIWGIWDMILAEGELPKKIDYSQAAADLIDSAKKILEKKEDPAKEKAKTPDSVIANPEAKVKEDDTKVIEPVIDDVTDTTKPDEPKNNSPEFENPAEPKEVVSPDVDIRD